MTKFGEGVRYTFEVFFDSRFSEDLSVDLIGESGSVQDKKLRIVSPIAHADFASAGIKESFIGWAGLRRKIVPTTHLIVKTPKKQGDNPNPLHCDIIRENFRTKEHARALAYELAGHAEKSNLFVADPLPK